MELFTEFLKIFRSRLTAWYLAHEDDYSACDTCGYDNSKPYREDIETIINDSVDELLCIIKYRMDMLEIKEKTNGTIE